MNGEGAVGAATTESIEGIPGGGAVIDFVMGVVVAGGMPLPASAVVCMTCPASMFDVCAARGIWDEVTGAVIEATVGRLVNVRCCGNGIVSGEIEDMGGPIGLVIRVGSALGDWRIVPCVGAGGAADSTAEW
ncbi:MAG TPA: hypothetical protein VK901_13775 [Nitrospiraceae bacterium]|nr:hypothetical protein [Nitrospiraceae bacterium]